MRLDDIKKVDGVWVADINTSHRRLKNKSSIRQVALIPWCWAWVSQITLLIAAPKEMLSCFLNLGLRQGRRGVTASNWFGRFLSRQGITATDKVFHSFRHTLIDYCKQAGLDETALKDIVGHDNSSITYGLYGKRSRPQAQLDFLAKLTLDST